MGARRKKPKLTRRAVRARIRAISAGYDVDDLDWRDFQSLLLSEGLSRSALRRAGVGSVRIIGKYGTATVRPIQRRVAGLTVDEISEKLSEDDFLARVQATGMTYREVYTLGLSP